MQKLKLEVRNLSKNFGKEVVLDNINFRVSEGEIVCIVGRSGCGKTTLLRLIAGLEKNFQGEITIDGVHNTDYLEQRRIGLISQKYNNFSFMTVYENIIEGTKDADPQHVEHVLKQFDMLSYKDFYPTQLSGGTNQRVAIMRSIIQNADIICADEPFGALDVTNRAQAQLYFHKVIKDNKKTAVFVTHDIEEALLIADKICVLSQKDHTIVELLDNPLAGNIRNGDDIRFTKQFMELRKKISQLL